MSHAGFRLIASVGLGMTLFLAGCGGKLPAESNVPATTQDEAAKTEAVVSTEVAPTEVGLGEKIPVNTPKGDLEVSVEGFVKADSVSMVFSDSDNLGEGKGYAALELVVKNVSYKPEYSDNFIDLSSYMRLEDIDGVTFSPKGEGTDFDGYEPAAGAFIDIAEGQAKRIVIFYNVDSDTGEAVFRAGNSLVRVPLKEE